MQHDHLVSLALQHYAITNFSSHFIRHNDNITFKIMNHDDHNCYVLRIHSPITSGLQGVQHTFDGINAEMLLLNHLNEQTSLALQQPIKNNNGNWISTIIDTENHRIHLATLLSWKEGEAFTGKEVHSKNIAYEVGAVLAKLHQFSQHWSVPQPFIRPNYSIEKYRHLTERLQYGVEINLFTVEQYEVLLNALNDINIVFDKTPKTLNNWGIIHADLQGGNIIVNGDTVIPIDFGFSGYGYYLFDLGITLTSFNIEHRKNVLEGYKTLRTLKKEDELLISAGFLLGIFGGFSFMINNEKAHEWIQRRMPYVTQNYCKAFLEGKSFLLDIE